MSNKKEIWKIIIQTLITILTAIGTSLGVTAYAQKNRPILTNRTDDLNLT